MSRLSTTRVAAALAVLSALSYVLMFAATSLAPSPFADEALTVIFPGFARSYVGFLTGLGWSIVYSFYIAVVYVPTYNLCCRVIPDRRAEVDTTTSAKGDPRAN